MSKVDELRKKYPNVTEHIFKNLVLRDTTNTKKYLDYMLKIWSNKKESGYPSNSYVKLTDAVNEFDKLLPYIENKDIYHSYYSVFSNLRFTVDKALIDKDEKTFVRDEHIIVLDETDTYLLIQPKTHRGSLKYGANTKWCTASVKHPDTFTQYSKYGCLIYLIDKTNKRKNPYSKVAFLQNSRNSLFDGFSVFDSIDNHVFDNSMIEGGWSFDEVIRISTICRITAYTHIRNAYKKMEVDDMVSVIESLNFDKMKNLIELIDNRADFSYISEIQGKLKNLAEKLKTF